MREPVEGWFNLAVHRGTCMDEDMDAFGGCYTACMKRCVDDCRRDPAICPGARGAAPPSAASSAPPSAGPPTSTWSRQAGNNPLFFPNLLSARRSTPSGEGADEAKEG